MVGKRLSNADVVKQLKECLAAMEIKGENRFGIRAYQNVIASIGGLTSSVYDLWENGRLDEVAGMGSSLVQHLDELFKTGEVKEWVKRKKDLPEGMFELIALRGVGAKTAFKLSKEFGINKRKDAFKKLKKAADSKKIRILPGFGEKSEKDILESLSERRTSKKESKRNLLVAAEEVSNRVIKHICKLDVVIQAVPLGSLRRRSSTVGDIDIAVSSDSPKKVIDHFVKLEEIDKVDSHGERMSTVILKNGMQVDVLVSDPDSFGSMLQHFTGSKQHNIELRTYALEKKMSLSQYGVKVGKELKKFDNEEKFYSYLGLKWIPPELREGRNEIVLAKKDKLPKLIELEDIKGDMHFHTTESDGTNTLQQMVDGAKELGYEYVGVCDHAPSVQTRGRFDVLGAIDKKRRLIKKINSENDSIELLYGYEVNILVDSSLSMPDEIMEKLDFVVAGIHTSFKQDRETITNRILFAIKHPLVNVIAHPSGRIINERSAYELDWDKVFLAAAKHGKILEINAQPTRLDLPDHLVKDAINKGIKLVVTTDAHSVADLDLMKHGVDVARRGWCEKENIINTYEIKKFKKALKIV